MRIPSNYPTAGFVTVDVANVPNADNVVASLAYPWKAVAHADSPFTPTLIQTKLFVDVTNGPVTVKPPVLPAQSLLVVKISVTAAGIVTVNAPTGWTIEDPGNQGSFGSTGSFATQGGCVVWQFDDATSKMIIVWRA